MLSRIAESLFWIGRYVERADATARLLQTHLRMLSEDTGQAEADTCGNLLALMSVEGIENPDAGDLLRVLCYEASAPSSIFFAWSSARDNARRAREFIPMELWECINTTWQRLPNGQFNTARTYPFLDWVRSRSGLFNGIARGTMVRDDGWQFLSLGRSIEAADMTSRMVASAALGTGTANWPLVLRGAGGYDSFLRTRRGLQTDREAAKFLVLDSRFPRSVMHGLRAASDSLARVAAAANQRRDERAEDARRQLGRQVARLEYLPVEDLIKSLDQEMTGIQTTCADVTALVAATFFAAADATAWITEGTR